MVNFLACEQAQLFGQGIADKAAGEKNRARKTFPSLILLAGFAGSRFCFVAFDRDTLSKQAGLLAGF